jgi:uncharacterized protein with HEPN domain
VTTPRDWQTRLVDIVEFADEATRFVGGMSYDQFSADVRTRFAVQYALPAVGEAAKSLPGEIRDRTPHVDWRGVIGTRDRLAHGYAAISIPILWRSVTVTLPALREGVAALLAQPDARPGSTG